MSTPEAEVVDGYDKKVHKHLTALRRRQLFLTARGQDRNDYDKGELSALTWALDFITNNSPVIAHAVKSK